MIQFVIYILGIFCLSPALFAYSDSNEEIQEFLAYVRNPPYQDTMAVLSGSIRHKSKKGESSEYPLELRLKLSPATMIAQIIVNDHERYLLKQIIATGENSVDMEPATLHPESSILTSIGFVPGDFTLSFLYWPFEKELHTEKVRGQKCRVVVLKHPSKDIRAKIWISNKYYFPLKVAWYDDGMESAPYKTITFTGFEKNNDFWIVKELKITGDKGKSVVRFNNNRVTPIDNRHPFPDDFFLKD